MSLHKSYEPMSDRDWRTYGLREWVFVKAGTHVQGHTIYNTFTADGTFLIEFSDYEVAFREIRRHQLVPLWVH